MLEDYINELTQLLLETDKDMNNIKEELKLISLVQDGDLIIIKTKYNDHDNLMSIKRLDGVSVKDLDIILKNAACVHQRRSDEFQIKYNRMKELSSIIGEGSD